MRMAPSPTDGRPGLATKLTLDWADSLQASTYDLYFGTQVDPPLYAPRLTSSTLRVSLQQGVTYYWYVIANIPTFIESGLKDFTAQSYIGIQSCRTQLVC